MPLLLFLSFPASLCVIILPSLMLSLLFEQLLSPHKLLRERCYRWKVVLLLLERKKLSGVF